jgi:hypothetical protein
MTMVVESGKKSLKITGEVTLPFKRQDQNNESNT